MPTGERRHLTILFCDLVGSVTLAAKLDPEDWHAMVADYQRAVSAAITRFGGYVAKYLGDGVMAFFGYPVAHENDAERAARAGLAILEALTQFNAERSAMPELAVRIGIDSGPVVVGAGVGKDVDAFGNTANIAARVQAAADAASVFITSETHRLISGLFVVEDRGPHSLKGLEREIQLYRVMRPRPSGMRGRFEAAAAAGGLTSFVGREDELRSLLNRWVRAREGEGQVVTIIGEAGIGKSRLLRRFRQAITATPHTWLEAGAGAFFQNTPFYAVGELLRQILGNAQIPDQIAQLERRLAAAGLRPVEAIPLLAPLLNLALPQEYPASTLPPEQQRRRLLATLVEWLLGAARTQPLVSVIEDLHWADPSTIELIELLVEQGATAPLLLLYTARPEFRVSWPPRAHHAQISLNRLNVSDVRTMVTEVAAAKALSDATVTTVVERTGGVPLFVEELTRAVLESGDGKFVGRAIPVTLHDSLMARLDRLGPAREVIQIGAVLGGDFSYELLQAVHPIAEAELQTALRKLADAELLYVRGIAPDASYQFKHALIRDAAYEALLKTRRRELHIRIANTIDQSFPDLSAAHPELLAHHYTEAGSNEQAVRYWQRAGEQAVEHSAHVEAISHLNHGLELLKNFPPTPEHAAEELKVQITLGVAIGMIKGYASVEGQAVYERARELCEQVGDSQQLCQVLWALWRLHHVRAEFQQARELGGELLHLAERNHNRDFLLQAHHSLWTTLILLGEFTLAKQHLDHGMVIYDFEQHRSHAFLYGGHDPGVCCRGQLGYVLWYLGYPEQALKSAQESITLAQKLSHPYSLVMILECTTMLNQFCRNVRETQEGAETVAALAREQGFPVWSALATLYRGWALAEQGMEKEGTSELHRGMAAYRASGAGLGLPYQLAHLAEIYSRTGQIQEGLNSINEALSLTEKTGDRRWLAELHRLKGVLTLRAPSSLEHEAEDSFQRAIAIARGQQAKSLELRATMSLARLLIAEGRSNEARAMLAEIYNWFTEGFDTADLKDAKALLDELST
ncbi:MAG TPA: adenylate/guanylate cyclase domain-containing protein [Candidatus Binataceae bacterium]|nr:adenylate/guanylate cyclase domain-containing protein [Candidatus Binataceae bacterium]